MLADSEVNYRFGCISYQRWIKDTTFVLVEETELCIPFDPEAEIVAMDSTIRLLALPLVQIVDEVFGITKIQIMGDSQGMLCVMKSGRNPTMRHLSRSHRVSVA